MRRVPPPPNVKRNTAMKVSKAPTFKFPAKLEQNSNEQNQNLQFNKSTQSTGQGNHNKSQQQSNENQIQKNKSKIAQKDQTKSNDSVGNSNISQNNTQNKKQNETLPIVLERTPLNEPKTIKLMALGSEFNVEDKQQEVEQVMTMQAQQKPVVQVTPPQKSKLIPPPTGLRKGNPPNIPRDRKPGPPKIPVPIIISQISNQQKTQQIQRGNSDHIQRVNQQNRKVQQRGQWKQVSKDEMKPQQTREQQKVGSKTEYDQICKKVQYKNSEDTEPKQNNPNIQNPQVNLKNRPEMKYNKKVETLKQVRQIAQVLNNSSEYNELQQRLRRLEQLRSRIDQSSEQDYSAEQDQNIDEEEEQLEGSVQGLQQQKGQINIIDERNIHHQDKDEYKVQHAQNKRQEYHNSGQEFKIGQTNYEQMQLKDQMQLQPYFQGQNKDQIQLKTQFQGYKETNVQNEMILETPVQNTFETFNPKGSQTQNQFANQTQIRPDNQIQQQTRHEQTVYQSNIATQQTKHQYLLDEVSNSDVNSQQQRGHNHFLIFGNTNSVPHAEKYHSQINISSQSLISHPNIQNDQTKQKFSEFVASQNTDGQLLINKYSSLLKQQHHRVKQQHHRATNKSQHVVHGEELQSLQANKQNQTTYYNVGNIEGQATKQKSIQNLLQQFKNKKYQYSKNLWDLKKKQQNYSLEQFRYQQKINELIQKVNHKNIMILCQLNEQTDIPQRNDRQAKDKSLFRTNHQPRSSNIQDQEL